MLQTKWISTILCVLFTTTVEATTDTVEKPVETVVSGDSAVLEFEQARQDNEEEVQNVKDERSGGVEMILGGQGEGGIAKRKQIQITE